MKEIFITKGKTVIVDDSDFEVLSKTKWFALNPYGDKWYAARKVNGKLQFMHRFILGLPAKFPLVDHFNGNGLDNQRHNLRVCNHAQNSRNSKLGPLNTSGYKGVSKHENRSKWVARIKVNGEDIALGNFKTAKEAAYIYDQAAKKYFGEFANTNNIELSDLPNGKPPIPYFRKNSIGARGVVKIGPKYRATIFFQKKTIYIGRFDTIEEASEAYEKKAKELEKSVFYDIK